MPRKRNAANADQAEDFALNAIADARKGDPEVEVPTDPLTREPDWTAFDALTDEDIRKAREADPDAAPFLDAEWFKRARVVPPR